MGRPFQISPYQILLKAGSHFRLLRQVHGHLITTARHHHLPLLTRLATSAITAREALYAQRIFLSAPTVDPFLFSSLITTSSKSGFPLLTTFFYHHMLAHKIPPTNYTCTSLIKSYAQLQSKKSGKMVHGSVIRNMFHSDEYVQAALVNLYSKVGGFEYARKVFDGMPCRNTVSWTSMISCYEQNGFPEKAIELFREMRELGIQFDNATLTSVLSACAHAGALELGMWLHEWIQCNGISVDVIGTALIYMYAKCGNLSKARGVFDQMSEHSVAPWTAIISAYGVYGLGKEAMNLFRLMIGSGIRPNEATFVAALSACAHTALIKSYAQLQSKKSGKMVHGSVIRNSFHSDEYVQAALVNLYSKVGGFEYARKVFDGMPFRNTVSWTSMISCYEQNGFPEKAIELFREMRELGIQFDNATLTSVLSACAHAGALELGMRLHVWIQCNGISVDVCIGTALINMYAKCGNVSKARGVFDQMSEHSVAPWTAIISAYGVHGLGKEAMNLFRLMIGSGIRPNKATFVAALSACAHTGLILEGSDVLTSMKSYGIVPSTDHHVCMVDMFGRAGLLDKAFQYINDLAPDQLVPSIWTAMLSACKVHKKYDLGVTVADSLFAAGPENAGHYVLLSNMYALAGKWERVEMSRNALEGSGLNKVVGYSTIYIDQKAHLFSCGDLSHPESMTIYQLLDEMIQRIKTAGYYPFSQTIIHELEEEEKQHALRYHSEKLAIAFGLLKTAKGTSIRIVKNLRICEDCHTAVKLVSLVYEREITVRDNRRFHHFKDGLCSCMDYW